LGYKTHVWIYDRVSHEWPVKHEVCSYRPSQTAHARWPELISCPAEDRKMSWLGWLIMYQEMIKPEEFSSEFLKLLVRQQKGKWSGKTHFKLSP